MRLFNYDFKPSASVVLLIGSFIVGLAIGFAFGVQVEKPSLPSVSVDLNRGLARTGSNPVTSVPNTGNVVSSYVLSASPDRLLVEAGHDYTVTLILSSDQPNDATPFSFESSGPPWITDDYAYPGGVFYATPGETVAATLHIDKNAPPDFKGVIEFKAETHTSRLASAQVPIQTAAAKKYGKGGIVVDEINSSGYRIVTRPLSVRGARGAAYNVEIVVTPQSGGNFDASVQSIDFKAAPGPDGSPSWILGSQLSPDSVYGPKSEARVQETFTIDPAAPAGARGKILFWVTAHEGYLKDVYIGSAEILVTVSDAAPAETFSWTFDNRPSELSFPQDGSAKFVNVKAVNNTRIPARVGFLECGNSNSQPVNVNTPCAGFDLKDALFPPQPGVLQRGRIQVTRHDQQVTGGLVPVAYGNYSVSSDPENADIYGVGGTYFDFIVPRPNSPFAPGQPPGAPGTPSRSLPQPGNWLWRLFQPWSYR